MFFRFQDSLMQSYININGFENMGVSGVSIVSQLSTFTAVLIVLRVLSSDRRIIGFADLKSVRSDKIRRITRREGRIQDPSKCRIPISDPDPEKIFSDPGSSDPDPNINVTDPDPWIRTLFFVKVGSRITDGSYDPMILFGS